MLILTLYHYNVTSKSLSNTDVISKDMFMYGQNVSLYTFIHLHEAAFSFKLGYTSIVNTSMCLDTKCEVDSEQYATTNPFGSVD